MKHSEYSRRKFIKTASAGAGAASVMISCSGRALVWRFFTVEEAELAGAIAGRIIPPDEDPGAFETGAANYIDKQLAGLLKKYREQYRTGLPKVQATAKQMFGGKFESLSAENKDEMLRALESGEVDEIIWGEQSSGSFFRLIRDHTMQGFYGSPRHGGNKNYASYRMIELDYPQIIGQNRYEDAI